MFELNKTITVNSRKFDGSIHRTWKAEVVNRDATHLTLVGKFEKEIIHQHLGVIRRGTISYEFFWFDRFYNIFRFDEPDGSLRNFYCNISLLPKFESNVLDFIDLDIDVVVWKDFDFQVLDQQEFEENIVRFSYGEDVVRAVEANLQILISHIENRQFPFDK